MKWESRGVGIYRVFLLSFHRVLPLYRLDGLHLPGHSVAATALRTATKETRCIKTVLQHLRGRTGYRRENSCDVRFQSEILRKMKRNLLQPNLTFSLLNCFAYE
jgi:hypothetical protein